MISQILIKLKNLVKKIVKGFTTNPSLMRKAGAKDYTKYSKDILAITNKPVSCEVFADNSKEVKSLGVIKLINGVQMFMLKFL